MTIETNSHFSFLSELYAQDYPSACLLPEYPSSNSDETFFQNRTKYLIHDPFPPPPRELLKILGPHHLMCGWGQDVEIASEVALPEILLDHWTSTFGSAGVPKWRLFDSADKETNFITLFPHQSLSPQQQVLDPDVNYALHSKEVIEKIDCLQAKVFDSITPPCIVKLSHGYAGLGNFLILNESDETEMRKQLTQYGDETVLVINSIIEDIVGDFGVQFYLRGDGSIIWLGFTEQHFDSTKKWCGGTFSSELQQQLLPELGKMIEPAGKYLHECGYVGVVGIDILRDRSGDMFLVDVNPRLTGITPFLMASRIFAREGLNEGIYQASCRFKGSFSQLVSEAESLKNARVLVHSAFESGSDGDTTTICHLSVTTESQDRNQKVLQQILQP
ncbi:ATP-grasp domain-containing protein [Mariniblastus sp.]|nr:ATP-grasp domain-containing protein [Mariniblastus sp.]